jgi:hypothetical protein
MDQINQGPSMTPDPIWIIQCWSMTVVCCVDMFNNTFTSWVKPAYKTLSSNNRTFGL